MKLRNLIENNQFKRKKLEKIVRRVESYQKYYASLSDEKLKDSTTSFKQRLQEGETLNDLLPEAFAAIREADKRVLGLFPYPVQIMGGIVLNAGNLAEMKTGEGKTLTETMPVYLNALEGKGVHVITVNEYLSARDYEEMGPVFKWMNLTVGLNSSKIFPSEKKKAYDCDITYSTNTELGFDYLRDNMVISVDQQVQRGLNYAIVDEADSILIDEARMPLIIAGKDKSQRNLYKRADEFAKSLNEDDYDYDKETKTVALTPSGADKANTWFGLKNIFDSESFTEAHFVDEALKANYSMKRDQDYVVQPTKDGHSKEVDIVDQNTGRVMAGRRYSDGLHQAIEAKENVPIKDADKTEADTTYQNYFRMYSKLSGMTGTAASDAQEFYDTYHMQVISIPTNKPVQRQDLPDIVFATKRAKLKAVLDKIIDVHSTERPILVGTISVESSEEISEMLNERDIPHEVLNAKNNGREAEIIAQAGQQGAITIATNMAGRGTDIKLGPHVRELGGLFVLGTEHHESQRIDDQLRGRSGRQGDPGTSQFYVSLEDDLLIRYGTERVQKVKQQLIDRGDEYEPIESLIVRRGIIEAQKRVEGNAYDERKNTVRYDDVMKDERDALYRDRNKVLNYDGDFANYLIPMFARTIKLKVDLYCQGNNWNYDGLFRFCKGTLGFDFGKTANQDLYIKALGYGLTEERIESMTKDEIIETLIKVAREEYQHRIDELVNPEDISFFQKVAILRAVDVNWRENIATMEQFRQSVTLRGYGQYNPLVEYQNSSFDLYSEMLTNIQEDITRNYMRASIVD